MKILVGICGSIASYRSPDFVKELRARGHEVRIVLTSSAAHFVSKKVLETFAGSKVADSDIFHEELLGTDHISWARWAERIVIYGATATTLSRLASASGDDFLSLQVLAFNGSPIVVPAMNSSMWQKSLLQENVKKLRAANFRFVGPIEGLLACGEEGVGHIADHKDIIAALEAGHNSPLTNLRVFLTGGPMRSSLDPARFLQNRSSGEMAISLAEAFHSFGAEVTLLLGPVDSKLVERAERLCHKLLRFESYGDYEKQVEQIFPTSNLFVSAAAVLDFTTAENPKKSSRMDIAGKKDLSIKISATDDVVARCVRQRKSHQKILAFSLENGSTAEILDRAEKKLKAKGADWILVNRADEMFSATTQTFTVWLLDGKGSRTEIEANSKAEIAGQLVQEIASKFSSSQNPRNRVEEASADRIPRA